METKLNKTQSTLINPPTSLKGKLKFVGPGLIVAATGVGAGDFIMATIAGTSFGWSLMWVIAVGAYIKYVLSEGVGRWYLATGKTFLQGWHSLGWWATVYFGIYSVIFGIIYGAAEPAISALVITAMFPGTSFELWAIVSGVAGFVLVWFGKYEFLEKLMTVLIGIMFVTVIGSAVIILLNIGNVSYSLAPSIPEGSFFKLLGIIGGVGGSITLTSYSYWLHAKGWKGKKWIPIMKIDLGTAFTITGMFAIAVMIIAAELLFGSGTTISGNEGLLGLADTYGERFGSAARWILLIGIWVAVFTSIIGPWHGISYLFADFVRIVRNKGKSIDNDEPISEKDPAFRIYLAWMTFPPMLLLLFNQPVAIVLIYGVLGAIFMPILSIGLLILLNSKRVDPDYRNGKINNIVLGLIIMLFLYLGASELYHSFFS
ncbi:Mn2+/Fe2+ NRAMP family transporter [Bacillus pakistanensis]|uniref:Mn2+/Fe2+ NRAMP family transporter n=1 Tax=Rossellomorea pakistanensis TaxID=992288 RepID=A0ABS2NBZ6_9BACI|nr:Nramp family divalent metal transporter [Bacillus pakistanensis]MBM7585377.1 Mn2+/Fe2+ NRAMP family transporter [Bacillus pakistanensis]